MKTNKVLYGLLAFGPIGFMVLGISSLFLIDALDIPHSDQMGLMKVTMILVVLGGVLGVLSLIMHLIHVSRNSRLSADQRSVWMVAIVMANGIASIAYFFMVIVKEGDELPPTNQPPPNPWN